MPKSRKPPIVHPPFDPKADLDLDDPLDKKMAVWRRLQQTTEPRRVINLVQGVQQYLQSQRLASKSKPSTKKVPAAGLGDESDASILWQALDEVSARLHSAADPSYESGVNQWSALLSEIKSLDRSTLESLTVPELGSKTLQAIDFLESAIQDQTVKSIRHTTAAIVVLSEFLAQKVTAIPTSDQEQSLEQLQSPKQFKSLDMVKARYAAELESVMRWRAFGGAEPTVAGFKDYLSQLARTADTTFASKKETCQVINFWKQKLHLAFFYRGTECRLTAKSNGAAGQFWLRSAGSDETLKIAGTFPSIQVRISEA